MGKYSPEVERRNCLFHVDFNAVDGDRIFDLSPQANDATVAGGSLGTDVGVVGEAGVFGEDTDLSIDSIDTTRDYAELSVGSWHYSQRTVTSGEVNVEFKISFSSGNETLTHSVNSDVDGWQFAFGTYDGDDIRLYYAQRGDGTAQLVERVDGSGYGDSNGTFNISWQTNGRGRLDDVRIYDTALTETEIDDLYSIGNEHNSVDLIGEHWNNAGLPFWKGQGNARLGGSLAESDDYIFRQLDYILESQHVDDAAGLQLDRIGALGGISRKDGEGDNKYRARIKARIAAGRSDGTFSDVIEIAAVVLDTTVNDLALEPDYPLFQGRATLYVNTSDLNAVNLTTAELKDILDDTVLAGHELRIVDRGDNPFTLTDDASANDASLGLTSDSISTGGTLVQDT